MSKVTNSRPIEIVKRPSFKGKSEVIMRQLSTTAKQQAISHAIANDSGSNSNEPWPSLKDFNKSISVHQS